MIDTSILKELERISQEVEKLTESETQHVVAMDGSKVEISFRSTSAIGWH
jgi:hypothetical protein